MLDLDYLVESLSSAAAGPLLGRYSADPEGYLEEALGFTAENLASALAALELADKRPDQIMAWRSFTGPLAGVALGLDTAGACLAMHPGTVKPGPNPRLEGGPGDFQDSAGSAALENTAAALLAQLADFHQRAHELHLTQATLAWRRGSATAELRAGHTLLATLHQLLAGLHHLVAEAYADGQLSERNIREAKVSSNAALAELHHLTARLTKQALAVYANAWGVTE